MMAIFGAIIPRFALLVGWYNDPGFWTNVYSSPFLFLLGFIFLPWTTLIYGLAAPNGMTIVNWIFLLFGLLSTSGRGGSGSSRRASRPRTTAGRSPGRDPTNGGAIARSSPMERFGPLTTTTI